MGDQPLQDLVTQFHRGQLDRRHFLVRAIALGLSASTATALFVTRRRLRRRNRIAWQ